MSSADETWTRGISLAGRYELIHEIGRGGRGVVYRARDPRLGRDVAVKLVPPTSLDPDAEERFAREARMVAGMDHPSIVPVHDFGRHDGTLFFVMPLVAGRTLRELLDEEPPTLRQSLGLAIQVADALDYSHRRGIVHRDIKPENIMTELDGARLRARVMDYGLAHDSGGRRLTRTGNLPGTLAYLSPEQVAGADVDGRADLYSLGVVLYECLTGEPPFTGPLYAVLYRIVHEAVTPPSALDLALPGDLETWLMKCLDKDPAQRPEHAGTLAEALRGVAATLGRGQGGRLQRPSRRTAGSAPLLQLVGRREECDALQGRLDRALGGSCQLVLLAGDAGIGKSRLLREVESWARTRAVPVSWGYGSGFGAGQDSSFPYQAFADIIQDHFRSGRASSSSSGDSQRVDLSDLIPDLVALFPQLAEVPGISGLETTPPALSGKTAVFELLSRTLVRLAGGRPLVLLLEHLHLDAGSVEALGYLLRRLAAVPLLIAGSYRSAEVDRGAPLAELHGQLTGDPRYLHLVLEPLDRTGTSRLLEARLGGRRLSPGAAARIHEITEGNPLFAEETLRSLLDRGHLTQDGGSLRLVADDGLLAGPLPATLQQAAEAQLDRLSEDLRPVLETAAVIGRRLQFEDLEDLFDDVDALDDAVDRLVERGVLEEQRLRRGEVLHFPSGVLREVVIRGLSRRRRRRLHRRHAEALERRWSGRLARIYPRLVHHYALADVGPQTVRYGLELARQALDTRSPSDAARAALTALELVDADGVEEPERAEAELLELLARSYLAQGDVDRACQRATQAQRAFAASGEGGRAAAAWLLAAEAAWQGRRIEDARRWSELGIVLARREDEQAVLARLLDLGAILANLRGEYERARVWQEEADALTTGDPEGSQEVPRGGVLRTAMVSRVERLVPGGFETDEEVEIASNVYETLLSTNAEGGLAPHLCRRWRHVHLEPPPGEGSLFELELRDDVRFSDGEPLRAADVAASLEAAARAGRDNLAPGFFLAIRGMEDLLDGRADHASGLEVVDPQHLRIHLTRYLPIFPALLTDIRTAVVRRDEDGRLLGTGPFVLDSIENGRVRLRRNDDYWKTSARVEAIDFRTGMPAVEIAGALGRGEIDLGRDLPPRELEHLLRDPRLRGGLAETIRKNTYFVLFHRNGPFTRRPAVRRALMSVVFSPDLVWRTLGRFAQPAVGLIPPGILGHDSGRRPRRLEPREARALLEQDGVTTPIRLRAAVHPVVSDRYGVLMRSLFTLWGELGVEVEVISHDQPSYLATYRRSRGIDLLIGRWNADYEDPDNFTFNTFHSAGGIYRRFFSDPDADALMESARSEGEPSHRLELYRRLEERLAESASLLPLFHDVEVRLARPRVRGLRLRGSYPYVEYAQVGVLEEDPSALPERRFAGELHVPIPGRFDALDPLGEQSLERLEVLSTAFETLTRVDRRGRVVPWLASFEAEADGARYRFRLRSDVRFHDGRRLTVRDVRYSFERLLRQAPADRHFVLLEIAGARQMLEGEAKELAGFEVISPLEFVLRLEAPSSFLPALLSLPSAAIVPEGSGRFVGSWREGCVGSGPFRLLALEPGRRVDLERHPDYWRSRLPKVERLSFHLGLEGEMAVEGFRAGRLSMVGHLPPAEVEALRSDRALEARFSSGPRLSTYFLLATGRGALEDPDLRRRLAQALDVPTLVGGALDRLATPAHGLFPPGLLGFEGAPPPSGETRTGSFSGLRLRVAVHRSYLTTYRPLWDALCAAMEATGIDLEHEPLEEATRDVDLLAVRWIADFPDPASFAGGLEALEQQGWLRPQLAGELLALAAQARREGDPGLRHALYRRMEDQLRTEADLIPLFHEQVYRLTRSDVRGLRLAVTFPEVRYEDLWLAAPDR